NRAEIRRVAGADCGPRGPAGSRGAAMSETSFMPEGGWLDRQEFIEPKNANWQQIAGGPVDLTNYDPPGPIGHAFMHEIHPVHFLMGPWGSGKTRASIIKTAIVSLRAPLCRDGIIRARGAILRDNFRALYRTTLESWFRVFPKDMGHF